MTPLNKILAFLLLLTAFAFMQSCNTEQQSKETESDLAAACCTVDCSKECKKACQAKDHACSKNPEDTSCCIADNGATKTSCCEGAHGHAAGGDKPSCCSKVSKGA